MCIGDSLTRGQSYKSANESFYNKYNYPYFLKEKYFFNSEYVINAARAGYTPRDVWENLYDDISVINNGLVILFLGTNQGLTDTVDIDCPGTILDNFATTQTGYYGKIIQLELNNNNNVILVSPYISSGNLTETKKAIVSFSKKYGLPVVDLNMSYFSNVLRTVNGYTDSTHLNSIGYSKLSDIIVQKASLYLQNNYCEKFIELEEQ